MKLYVNGSPKLENGNSNYFLNKIKDKEKIKCVYRDRFSDILKDIKKVDTIILCFPLYVDGPTCKIIEFMEYILSNKIDNFAKKNKAKYMGSFNIGAGEIVGKCEKFWLYKLISIPFLIKIKKFKECIDNGNEIILETTIRPMTKRLYVFMANINWKRQMIRNGCYK